MRTVKTRLPTDNVALAVFADRADEMPFPQAFAVAQRLGFLAVRDRNVTFFDSLRRTPRMLACSGHAPQSPDMRTRVINYGYMRQTRAK